MKKIISNTFFVLLFVLPLIARADVLDGRVTNENVVHDAQIILSLDSYDASSSLGILNISVDPGSQSMNASGVVLDFATSSIAINGILTGNSFCTFFLENNFNNTTGELRLSGMKPYPGEEATSLLGQIIFEKKDTGTSTISILGESVVLANNGFATNVLATTSDIVL